MRGRGRPQKRILPALIIIILSFLLTSTANWLQTTSVFGQASPVVTSRPAPRASDQMMTYDEGNRCVLLFGGTGQDTTHGDFWSWDGRRAWTLLTQSGPPPRIHSAAAFDRKRGVVVLFGPLFAPNQSNVAAVGSRGGVLVFEASNQAGTTGVTWHWDGKSGRRSARQAPWHITADMSWPTTAPGNESFFLAALPEVKTPGSMTHGNGMVRSGVKFRQVGLPLAGAFPACLMTVIIRQWFYLGGGMIQGQCQTSGNGMASNGDSSNSHTS